MPAPPAPRDRRPGAAALLAAACLATLVLAYGIIQGTVQVPGFLLALVLLLAMLQAFGGSQALEGRRLWVGRSGVALTLVAWAVFLPWGLTELWLLAPLGAASLCAIGAAFFLLPQGLLDKSRSTTH